MLALLKVALKYFFCCWFLLFAVTVRYPKKYFVV